MMEIYAKIIEDSMSLYNKRLTTFEISFPKALLAEFNTHRVFSRSFSSSRAIPTSKMNTMDTFYPIRWGANQAGMSAKDEDLSPEKQEQAHKIWSDTVEYCKRASEKLSELGLHKQWTNRCNDWHTMAKGIVTATEYDNFFELRCHRDAQPEIQDLAIKMKSLYESNTPKLLKYGEWHLPYITEAERNDSNLKENSILQKICAARCCRVSYNKHNGESPNVVEDIILFDKLAGSVPKHYSPLEHAATPDVFNEYDYVWLNPSLHGNFVGWNQFRRFDQLGQEIISD
jgi:thymidylate synthase ThyX